MYYMYIPQQKFDRIDIFVLHGEVYYEKNA